jgi:hypothetical protein
MRAALNDDGDGLPDDRARHGDAVGQGHPIEADYIAVTQTGVVRRRPRLDCGNLAVAGYLDADRLAAMCTENIER